MPENLPWGVTGTESTFGPAPRQFGSERSGPTLRLRKHRECLQCRQRLCDRGIGIGAGKCCTCDGRTGCPLCFPEDNDNDEEAGHD